MRLSEFQKKAILESVAEEFGEEAKVYLFGSRVDNSAKGGDIDLFVEVPEPVEITVRKKMNVLGKIQRKIGDQKIDLILLHPDEVKREDVPLIVKNARSQGVLL